MCPPHSQSHCSSGLSWGLCPASALPCWVTGMLYHACLCACLFTVEHLFQQGLWPWSGYSAGLFSFQGDASTVMQAWFLQHAVWEAWKSPWKAHHPVCLPCCVHSTQHILYKLLQLSYKWSLGSLLEYNLLRDILKLSNQSGWVISFSQQRWASGRDRISPNSVLLWKVLSVCEY